MMRHGNKVRRCLFVWVVAAVLVLTELSITVSAASPTLSQKSATLTVGQSLQLKVTNTKAKVTWASSNKNVAKVSAKGKVTALKAGKANITAKVSGKKYTCKIKVVNADSKATEVTFAVKDGGDFVQGISKATISFKLDYTSTAVKVSIKTISGTTVYKKTLSKCKENKTYSITWNGKTAKGEYVDPGIYQATITAGTIETPSANLTLYEAGDFAGGNGSSTSPYQVTTLEQLKNVNKHNGCYFEQTADIDCDSANFTPLFTSDVPFSGTYDGKKHTISNVCFRKTGDTGIFTAIGEEGIVKNLSVLNFKFIYEGEGYEETSHGTIAGWSTGTISGCTVSDGTMNGLIGTRQGGICGTNKGIIENCSAKNLTITGFGYSNNDACVAGIISVNNGGRIVNCQASDITATGWRAAGIVGANYRGDVIGCSTTGTCHLEGGYDYTGAICGYGNNGLFTDCWTDTEYPQVGNNYAPRSN